MNKILLLLTILMLGCQSIGVFKHSHEEHTHTDDDFQFTHRHNAICVEYWCEDGVDGYGCTYDCLDSDRDLSDTFGDYGESYQSAISCMNGDEINKSLAEWDGPDITSMVLYEPSCEKFCDDVKEHYADSEVSSFREMKIKCQDFGDVLWSQNQ